MTEFRMPSLGSDMESGTLIEWLKKPGDTVAAGDVIAVVETQKGAIEIEVFEPGVIERVLVELGTTVPVGMPIALITGSADAAPPKLSRGVPAAMPAPEPPKAKSRSRVDRPATPAARRLATERGIDLAMITGTGPDGAIIFVDVENALGQKRSPQAPSSPQQAATLPRPEIPAMRSVIAAATARSKREIPHYYLSHSVDLSDTMSWLSATNARRPPEQRLLLAAIFVKAIARAVLSFPDFNGFYREAHFEPSERTHVGIAVALRGGGLVAPALHDVDRLSLDEVMAQLRELVSRVRAGRFRSSELSDPTITLTSLGDRGVDLVIPVIYAPQVAILGAGSLRERPWIVAGNIVPRQIVEISLAGDHRVSDGHRGALFLAEWAKALQKPEEL